MTKKTDTNALLNYLVKSIDVNENTEWELRKQEITLGVRKEIVSIVKTTDDKSKTKRNLPIIVDLSDLSSDFLQCCNAIKTLLTAYNFGEMPEETQENKQEYHARIDTDKKIILDGIDAILDYVINNSGFIISPYMSENECRGIFGVEENDAKRCYVTLSATTVFTTLVYFRRAYMRLRDLFTEKEAGIQSERMKKIVAVLATIMNKIYAFAIADRIHFGGWGVTLDPTVSKCVELSDTYAVVDAISRYADAFTQAEPKRDKEITDAVDKYAKEHFGISNLTNLCLDAIYKTSFNVYKNVKNVYGKERAFYVVTRKETDGVKNEYVGTDYDGISASNRSSALFNPLYVAMITMYGYTDKEVVIRYLMDNATVVSKITQDYGDEIDLYASSDALKDYRKYRKDTNGNLIPVDDQRDYTHDFAIEKAALLANDRKRSNDYANYTGVAGGSDDWKIYYDAARVYQKFLEDRHPEYLMENIADFRDYLNDTKDAIDQVSVLYRDFENSQRLGIVDTDYRMYSDLDVAVESDDKVTVPKLNKANVVANDLRPLLLSSKIMIVNALTKYPQSDIKTLFDSIINKRYVDISYKQRKDDNERWLWNEDKCDINSTARHCETIAYDYFDYYDKYETSYNAIRNLRKNFSVDALRENNSVDEDGGFVVNDEEIKHGELMHLLLELTHQNVENVKVIHQSEMQKRLQQKDADISKIREEKDRELADKDRRIAELEQQLDENSAHAKQKQADFYVSIKDSLQIGETLRGWIKQELHDYLAQMMSMYVINQLNMGFIGGFDKLKDNYKAEEDYNNITESSLEKMLAQGIVDGEIASVKAFWENLKHDISSDPECADEKKSQYVQLFREAASLGDLLSVATNGILRSEEAEDIKKSFYSLEVKNEEIHKYYNVQLRKEKNEENA